MSKSLLLACLVLAASPAFAQAIDDYSEQAIRQRARNAEIDHQRDQISDQQMQMQQQQRDIDEMKRQQQQQTQQIQLEAAGQRLRQTFEESVSTKDMNDMANGNSVQLSIARKTRSESYAEYNKGNQYCGVTGEMKPSNYHCSAEAFPYFLKAANHGNVKAMSMIGFMYEKGDGFQQDNFKAAQWYRRAAEQGDPQAQIDLGMMYENGKGVPLDYVQAQMWYTISYSLDNNGAQIYRDYLAAKMNPAQLAESQRLANEWKPLNLRAVSDAPNIDR